MRLSTPVSVELETGRHECFSRPADRACGFEAKERIARRENAPPIDVKVRQNRDGAQCTSLDFFSLSHSCVISLAPAIRKSSLKEMILTCRIETEVEKAVCLVCAF